MLVPLIDHPALGYDAALPADLIASTTKLGIVGQVHLQLPPQSRTDPGLARIKPLLRAAAARVGPFKASEADAAVMFLDQGALTVYFDIDISTPRAIEVVLEAIHGIPPQRVAVLLHEHAAPLAIADEHVPASLLEAIHAVKHVVGTVMISTSTAELHSDFLRNLRTAVGPHIAVAIQCSATTVKHSEAARLHRHDMQLIYPAVVAMTKEDAEAAESRGHLDLGSTLAACARSDRADRLFATVVNDECGRTLGLVYSSFESILEAIRCGRGVYYSRSR
jgi:phosphoribosyl-AMP cyclohydrolase